MAASTSTLSSRIATKWVGLVAALWVQAISGNNYTFSNYSVALKAIMGYNQLQLNNLSVAKDVGKAFGVVGGLLADVLPPWAILLIGSCEGLLGYGVQWLVISQRIQPLPYWQMCVAMCLGGNSTTWMNTAVLVTCVRNFSRNRGNISGILKGYVGLSTAIFTDVCAALFTGDPSSFVLMLAIVPFVICSLAMALLKPVQSSGSQTEDAEDKRGFLVLNLIAIFLALYLLAYDITGSHSALVSKLFAGFLLFILAAPILLPALLHYRATKNDATIENGKCRWSILGRRKVSQDGEFRKPLLNGKEEKKEKSNGDCSNGDSESNNSLEKQSDRNTTEHEHADTRRRPRIGEEHSILEALQTLDFWLLFLTFLCGVGTGMAVINNLGQIGQSLGYKSVSIFISLTSIWGFFGRVASGALSEYAIRSAGIPRPVIMALSQLFMIVGYILLAIAAPGSLHIGSTVVGICYGVRIAVSVPTASELFGLRNFGLIYNILILNLPLGSFLFSGLLAGFLYDQEAKKGHNLGLSKLLLHFHGGSGLPGDALTCLGAHCYRLVFIVMAAVCALGFVLDLLLALRTRRLYKSMQLSRR